MQALQKPGHWSGWSRGGAVTDGRAWRGRWLCIDSGVRGQGQMQAATVMQEVMTVAGSRVMGVKAWRRRWVWGIFSRGANGRD